MGRKGFSDLSLGRANRPMNGGEKAKGRKKKIKGAFSPP